jgi:UDP-glucuronate decarboxylase
MKKVLITGATGQVGTRLAKTLSSAGFDVTGIGNREIAISGYEFSKYFKFDLLTQDIDSLIEHTRPAVLIHLAWETQPTTFWDSPKNFLWLDSSQKLIESFNNWGGERIVITGTCAEYDWEAQGPIDELGSENPKSAYGQTKLSLLNVLRSQPTPFLWTRTFFQFGGKETYGRVIPSLIDSLKAGQEFLIQKPDDIRDFVFIDDVVKIISSLILADKNGIFNVATGLGINMHELATRIALILDRQDLLRFGNQLEKPSIVLANMSKLQRTLGPFVYTNFENAILKTMKEREVL